MSTKRFSIGAILNVTSGVLLTSMDDIYGLLNYMTGDNLFTHQLPNAMRMCNPTLHEQFPWALDATGEVERVAKFHRGSPQIGDEIRVLLEHLGSLHGAEHDVHPLTAWTPRDPIADAEAMFGREKIVVVSV